MIYKLQNGKVIKRQIKNTALEKQAKEYMAEGGRLYGIGGPVSGPAIPLQSAKSLAKYLWDTYLVDYANNGRMFSYPTSYDIMSRYIRSPYVESFGSGKKGERDDSLRRALFGKYFGINPDELDVKPEEYLVKSKYRPSVETNPDAEYYTFIPQIGGTRWERSDLVDDFEGAAGEFKYGLGEDENGRYVSMYDSWDLNPFEYISWNGPIDYFKKYGANAIELYDRIYEKDNPELYSKAYDYGVRGGYIKDEEENSLASGGKIHIKPENRGKLIDLHKNGGVIKLQAAGIIPKLKTLLQKVTKATPKVLDSNIKEVPKTIQHVPRVTISEPYARLSRDGKIVNEARSFSIDGDPFNTFQLIKDVEPHQYSIHFKTLGRNALSEPQKQMLFQAVADAIPGGSTLSTGGSVSKGGLAGLKRFEGLGFKPTLQTRTLGLKMQPTAGEIFPFGELIADKVEVPILYKPKEVVAGSKPISDVERLGVSKGDRSTLNSDQIEAMDDLLGYLRNGRHKKYFLYDPKTETFRGSSSKGKDGEIGAVRALVEHGAKSYGSYEGAPIRLSTEYGNFTIWPNRNAAFTSNFPIPEGMKGGPGETNLMLEGDHSMKTILTSPRVDISTSMEDVPIELVNSLPNTIDKSIMRRFGSENDQMIRPGTYLSGDNGQMPLGNIAISTFDRTKSVDSALQSIINPENSRTGRTGLSPDSYSSIIRQGLRGNHKLRGGEGFAKGNDSAVENRAIYEAGKKMKAGEITPEQYKQIFDDGAIPLGGRPVEIRTTPSFSTVTDNDGITKTITQEPRKYVIMPHPYIMYRKQGGKI